MKKLISVLLMLALMMSASAFAEGTLVSTPAEVGSAEVTRDSVIIQDLYNYTGNLVSYDKIDSRDDGTTYRKFRGEDAYKLIDEYVKTLCSGNYNLKLVDSHYESYKSGDVFFSYAMDYTGSGRLSGEKEEMNFVDGVYGDVTIWGSKKYSNYEGYVVIRRGLEFGDLGLRAGGKKESTALPGESIAADLYRLDDGTYKTGDGRFHVSVGEAAVYADGKMFTTDASLTRNQEKNREELRIYNFYRTDSILLTVPYNSVLTGDILDRRAIGLNEKGGYEKYSNDMEDFLGWTFSNKILGVSHDGDYLFFYTDDYNDFDTAAVRVMYWDPKADVAVFYIYASFDSAPYEYEALAAVSLGLTPEGNGADKVFTVREGKSIDITFDETEYMPSYELFTWEIMEGSSLIELTGTRSQTCTLKAYDSGKVRLKVTYEYGAEGSNVLTGSKETKFLSKTREYVVNIDE